MKLRGGRDIMVPFDNWFIKTTLQHFKREMGTKVIQYRRPLTIDILTKMANSIDMSHFDNRVYITMATVGVYCLLRIGELCWSRVGDTVKFIRNRDMFKTKCISFALRYKNRH